MPHTSRKKSKPASHNKRQEILDENGWTHIVRQYGQKRAAVVPRPPQDDSRSPTQIREGYTLETTHKQYKTLAGRWEDSSCRKELVDWVESSLLTLNNLDINQCICTGIGSFTGDRDAMYPARTHCSYFQLAVFDTVLALLQQKFPIQEIYFQEPQFNDLDKEFLQTKGYTIITDPEARNRMTTSTFHYAPRNEWYVVLDALVVAHPALFIGDDLPRWCIYTLPQMNPALYIGDNLPDWCIDDNPNVKHDTWKRKLRIAENFLKDRAWRQMPDSDDSWGLYSFISWRSEEKSDLAWALRSTIFEKTGSTEEVPQIEEPMDCSNDESTGDGEEGNMTSSDQDAKTCL